jgi:hypothetical protein
MEFIVSVRKKHLVVFLVVVFLMVGAGFVFAALDPMIPTPGHSVSQIQKCGEGEILKIVSGVWGCGPDATGFWTDIGGGNIEYGQGNVRNTGSGAGYYFEERPGTGNLWAWYAEGGMAHLFDTVSGMNRISVAQGGNVGIGKAPAAGAKLDVAGGTNVQDNLWVGKSAYTAIEPTSSMGVGTDAPNAKLEVVNSVGGNSFKIEQGNSNLIVSQSGTTTVIRNTNGPLQLIPVLTDPVVYVGGSIVLDEPSSIWIGNMLYGTFDADIDGRGARTIKGVRWQEGIEGWIWGVDQTDNSYVVLERASSIGPQSWRIRQEHVPTNE